MTRVMIAAAMLLLTGAAHAAMASASDPVCREPAVVDEMTREIRTYQYDSRIDPALVIQQPTVRGNVVRCEVCLVPAWCDTLRDTPQTIRQCVVHAFEIRIVQSGFVVRDLR